MLNELRELARYRSLLRDLVARDIKVRYKRSALGILWTMLNPLLMMLVFSFAFSHILRTSVPNFAVYLLSGLLVWNFFAQATLWSSSCLLGYAGLIRKVYVPKSIFVIATVLAGLVNLLLSLLPLAIVMVLDGHPFRLSLLFLPVAIALTTVFSLGLALLLSPVCTLFQDVGQIYAVLLNAWFYLTPIIYPLETLPEKYRVVALANPMTYFVEAFRAPVYNGTIPEPVLLLRATVCAVVVLVTGWWVFQRNSDRVAYQL